MLGSSQRLGNPIDKADGDGLKELEQRSNVLISGHWEKRRKSCLLNTGSFSLGWYARGGPAPALHLLPLYW